MKNEPFSPPRSSRYLPFFPSIISFFRAMNGNGDLNTHYLGDGSLSTPSESFFYEQNTGIYHDNDTYPNSAWTMVKKGNKRIRVDDNVTTFYGTVNIPGGVTPGTLSLVDGSASTPSLNFVNSTSSGLYRGTSGVSISTGGTSVAEFSTNGGLVTMNARNIQNEFSILSSNYYVGTTSDSASLPGYSWNSDNKTGFYRPIGGSIGVSCNGNNVTTFAGSSINLSRPLQLTSGADPSLFWDTSPTSGFDYVNNNIRVLKQGSLAVEFEDNDTLFHTPIIVPATGTSGPLSIQSVGATNTTRGLGYLTLAGGQWTFCDETSAFANLTRSGSSIQSTWGASNLHVNSTDSKSAPGFNWGFDTDTGFFNNSANQIGVTCGGTQAATFTSTLTSFPGDVNCQRYYLRLYQAAGQTIHNNQATYVSWDTLETTGGGNSNFGTVTLPATTITIPKSGMYAIHYSSVWQNLGGSGLGYRLCGIEINPTGVPGATRYYGATNFPAGNTSNPNFQMTSGEVYYHFNANDTVALTVIQTTGGDLTFSNQSGNYSALQIVRLYE